MKDHEIELGEKTIQAINGELRYQKDCSGTDRADNTDNGVAGQLVSLTALIAQANEAWYSNADEGPALDIVRKIAATAVRALELYGCPERKGYEAPTAYVSLHVNVTEQQILVSRGQTTLRFKAEHAKPSNILWDVKGLTLDSSRRCTVTLDFWVELKKFANKMSD